MKKVFLLACAVVTFIPWSFAQDQNFYTTSQALVNMNPSFAGSNGGIRNQSLFQTYLSSYAGNYNAYQSSTDAYIKQLNAGVALTFAGDYSAGGMFRNNAVGLAYAQHVSLWGGKMKIIPSLKLSYGSSVFDGGSQFYYTVQQYPWSSATNVYYMRSNYLDVGAGLLVNYKDKLYVGGSLSHINHPEVASPGTASWYPLPAMLNLHASYNWQVADRFALHCSGLYQQQAHFYNLRAAANLVSFHHIITGVSYGSFAMPSVNLGYRNSYFSVTASYTWWRNRGDLIYWGATRIAELGVSVNLKKKELRTGKGSFESW